VAQVAGGPFDVDEITGKKDCIALIVDIQRIDGKLTR